MYHYGVAMHITIYAFSPMIVHMYSNPNPFFWPLNIISRFFLALSIGDFLLFSLCNSPSQSFSVPPPPSGLPVNVHYHIQKRYHARHWSSPLRFLGCLYVFLIQHLDHTRTFHYFTDQIARPRVINYMYMHVYRDLMSKKRNSSIN